MKLKREIVGGLFTRHVVQYGEIRRPMRTLQHDHMMRIDRANRLDQPPIQRQHAVAILRKEIR
jgi:hypothetical protein